MTKSEYAKYLQGRHWKQLRRNFLEEETHSWCIRCRMPRWLAVICYDQDLHVHHKTYVNLGHELWDDLEALCARCHEIETFGTTRLRAPRTVACDICGLKCYDTDIGRCVECSMLSIARTVLEVEREKVANEV